MNGGVVGQVVVALDPRNRLAALLGALLGAVVPVGTYWVAHFEVQSSGLWHQPSVALVLGGLLFSAKTVFQWGRAAFQDPYKAVGFVLLVEGTMVISTTGWLAITMLVVLVGINGVATGCTLALDRAPRRTRRSRTKQQSHSRLRAVRGAA